MPLSDPQETKAEADERAEKQVPPPGLHPFFRGLLETLPEPGSEWSRREREQWLETARNIFALIYQEPGGEREQASAAPPPVRIFDEARSEAQLDQRSA